MTSEDVVDLVIISIMSIGLIAIALVLLSGRGSWMLAGFNTLSKEEKSNYDRVALCKFMGKILLPIGITTPSIFIDRLLNTSWFVACYAILAILRSFSL